MAQTPVEIRGLRDFNRELGRIDPKLKNEMRKVHRKVSDLVAGRAKMAMAAGGRQSARAAGAVKARSTGTSAFIETVRKPPGSLGVIWGQKRRSGWYANPRYAASTARQFEPWVGNQWDPGEHGGKPYYIGPAINASLDDVEDIYWHGLHDVFRAAYPD